MLKYFHMLISIPACILFDKKSVQIFIHSFVELFSYY